MKKCINIRGYSDLMSDIKMGWAGGIKFKGMFIEGYLGELLWVEPSIPSGNLVKVVQGTLTTMTR